MDKYGNPIKLKDEKNVKWDLDPMVDIIFKSIFRKDEERYLIKVLMKELFGVKIRKIEEKDSYFIAKGKNKKGEVCDYLIKVDTGLISIECNKRNDPELRKRNYSHLKRTILQAETEAVQIHFDNFDIRGEGKLIYSYSMKDEEGREGKYQNLIRIFHINLASLAKRMYNEDIRKFTKFEKVLLLFLIKTRENLKILVKEEGELEYMKKRIEDILEDVEIMAEYTNHEIELIGERREAEKEKEKEMVKRMLLKKIDINTISECTDLSIEDIKALSI